MQPSKCDRRTFPCGIVGPEEWGGKEGEEEEEGEEEGRRGEEEEEGEEDGGRKRTKLLDQCMHISNMVWVSSDVCHMTSWCGCQVMCAI